MAYNFISWSNKWGSWVVAAILVITCIIIYTPAMRGDFIWDDDAYITDNPLITAPDGMRRIWFSFDHPSQYFPLTYTVFRLGYQMWGFDTFGYHLINVLIHIANAFLVWIVLVKLRLRWAWLAVLIFALHPINVESVAWITELKNVLMAFFFLLSFLLWLKFIENPEPKAKDWLIYTGSFIFYALALFSKTTACTLPIVMMLVLWSKHISIREKHWRRIIPYIVFGIMMGFVTIWWEQVRGASASVLRLNYLERFLLAGRALWFYIGKLILPVNLTFSYPLWDVDWTKPFHYTWTLAAVFVAVLMWYYRAKIGRWPIAVVVFFVVTLAPVLGFVSIYTHYYSYVADHYVYVACIGPIALFAAAISIAWHKSNNIIRIIISVCLVAGLMYLCVTSWRQSHIYKDLETLWQDTLKKNPNSPLAWNNMGIILENRGNKEEAMTYYRKVLKIHPDDEVALYNIGTLLKSEGKLDEAVSYYQKAIRIQPGYAAAHNNLANTLKMQGKVDEAIEHYKKALSIQPLDAIAHYNLANTLRSQGQLEQAITLYKRAAELNPQFSSARFNLAVTLESAGRIQEAISQYRKILEFDPNAIDAINALAELLISDSDPNIWNAGESVRYAKHAAELTDYNNPAILRTLGLAYIAAGDVNEAMRTAQIALDLAVATGDNSSAESIREWIKANKQSNQN
jgi:tetratricopeptide (TPR) repeat protein